MLDRLRLRQRQEQIDALTQPQGVMRIGNRDESGYYQAIYPDGSVGQGIKAFNATHQPGDRAAAIPRADGLLVFAGANVDDDLSAWMPEEERDGYLNGQIWNRDIVESGYTVSLSAPNPSAVVDVDGGLVSFKFSRDRADGSLKIKFSVGGQYTAATPNALPGLDWQNRTLVFDSSEEEKILKLTIPKTPISQRQTLEIQVLSGKNYRRGKDYKSVLTIKKYTRALVAEKIPRIKAVDLWGSGAFNPDYLYWQNLTATQTQQVSPEDYYQGFFSPIFVRSVMIIRNNNLGQGYRYYAPDYFEEVVFTGESTDSQGYQDALFNITPDGESPTYPWSVWNGLVEDSNGVFYGAQNGREYIRTDAPSRVYGWVDKTAPCFNYYRVTIT